MAVFLTSTSIDAGLGGTLREVLASEAWVAGCWPLGEVASLVARDISNQRNDGTWSGTGTLRGQPIDLPEGAVAPIFDGNGYVVVPDDGPGTAIPLSLTNGDMDVCALIATSTNDGTLRAIVQKQVTNSSGNGYHLAIQTGAVRFYCKVGGSVLFDFARGAIADGALHDIHAIYDTINHEAWINIDGAQAGAKVTGITATDPAYTAADLRIAAFNDGAGGFIGTIAFVSVGREGNANLGAFMHATRTWTALNADVRNAAPVTCTYGIPSSDAWEWLARPGAFQFSLENSPKNSGGLLGYYSLGHANCRYGFAIGTPIRWTLTYAGTTYYKFRGRIVGVETDGGVKRGRGVLVYCEDWFGVAEGSSFGEAPIQISQLSSVVMGVVVDQASSQPPSLNLGTGTQTLAYALDGGEAERQALTAELSRVASSEAGYLFQKGDTVRGGALTFVPRFSRQASAALATTVTDAQLTDAEFVAGAAGVRNVFKARIYPPTVDASPVILFDLQADAASSHRLDPGQSIDINCPYSDPTDRTKRIGGTELIAPVAPTDYEGNTDPSGSGTDRTDHLSVSAILGANMAIVTVENIGGNYAYLTLLQIRGKGVYRQESVDLTVRDDDSVRRHGERVQTVDQPYQGSITGARGVLATLLEMYREPVQRVRTVILQGNRSAAEMTDVLAREVGDRVGIAESVTGVVAGDGYFINSIELRYRQRVVTVVWTLAPSWPETLLVSYSGPVGISGMHDFSGGALSLTGAGDYTFTYNRPGDTVRVKGVGGGGGGGSGLADSVAFCAGGGGGGGACQTTGISVVVASAAAGYYTGKVGAAGAGGTPGTAGGTTEFRVAGGTVHLQLPGGDGGKNGAFSGAGAGGPGGAGGAAGTGSGNVAGTTGGAGDSTGGGGAAGTANASGAAGGGGGGTSLQTGRAGGNGKDQTGGAGGSTGNPGGNASGMGGGPGGGSSGGGGGGGGGVSVVGFHGGGGGGGSTGTADSGGGGNGGGGVLSLEQV